MKRVGKTAFYEVDEQEHYLALIRGVGVVALLAVCFFLKNLFCVCVCVCVCECVCVDVTVLILLCNLRCIALCCVVLCTACVGAQWEALGSPREYSQPTTGNKGQPAHRPEMERCLCVCVCVCV